MKGGKNTPARTAPMCGSVNQAGVRKVTLLLILVIILSSLPLMVRGEEECDVVILTKKDHIENLGSLISFEEERGFKVKVFPVDDFNTPEGIRRFLMEKYREFHFGWVIIVGDTDTEGLDRIYPSQRAMNEDIASRYEIPMWELHTIDNNKGTHNFREKKGAEHYFALSDFPYSNLTDETFDYDEDGFIGEYKEDSLHFSLFPDVFVGRIPFADKESIDSYVEGLEKYISKDEKDKKRSLLLGYIFFLKAYDPENILEPSTGGGMELEMLRKKVLVPINAEVITSYEIPWTKKAKNIPGPLKKMIIP